MTKLIGREAERKILDRFYQSSKAEFLAIYGRRRVGKTFLIQDFYTKKKDAVCFHSTGLKDGNLRDQIKSFTQVIGKTFYNGAELQEKSTWMDVFEQLTEAINKLPKNKKVILFFDEFPWMASKRSKLIQALDHYWNRYWSINPKIKLIVCGSAASWILEKLIHNKGGLYNRITYQIELNPFSLSESKTFLWEKGIKLSEEHVLKIYMVMGGIPLYLDQVEKGLSADQIIDSLCFTKRGLLFNEFDKLFQSLFEHFDIHKELILLISENIYGISQVELMNKSSKSVGGRLKKRLQELEDTGFIESFIPHQHKEKGIYYRIVDEYILFYLKWIAPVTNSIKRYDKEAGYWLSKSKSPSWKSWAGLAYEAICFKHISPIRKALHIPPGVEIGSWRYVPRKEKFQDQGAQIDLLFDREDGAITICEIKYNEQPFTIDKEYAQKLLNKANVYKQQTGTRKDIFIAMITKNGLKPSMYSEEIIHAVVTIKDLFNDND
jgi:AAA+ ATPase superfamily predicted ATPase